MTDPKLPAAPPGLDPEDWPAFRATAHRLLDAALDKMEAAREGRVWTPFPPEMKAAFSQPLPAQGQDEADLASQLAALLPYGVGNTHPRFFGWVHGSGTPQNLLAEIVASALNANAGGRDHGAIYVERQVISWCRQLFGFPETASGILVSGTSLATVIALKTARDARLEFRSRKEGVEGARLVGYASAEAHACNPRAFDIIGLGSDALRRIPVNDAFQMDTGALRAAIRADREAGLTPFLVIGTAGTVNTGSTDPLAELSAIAKEEGLWFHVDGAFGALARLSPKHAERYRAIEQADSLAFDFHKWMHVNYDAGCVLVREEPHHRHAFSDRPDYLKGAARGIAAGNPWPVEYGPELSRGFRALKVWSQIAGFGTERLGAAIARNCDQAAYLSSKVAPDPRFELLAPARLNICCFRLKADGLDEAALGALNEEIVIRLQESGIAAPSTTKLKGRTAIRVNLTNHRTQESDLDLLLTEIVRIGGAVLAA
ncbi:cytochrome D ubiquinol oxidase subunit I [Hyphomonas sp. WL0036]|uniref:pyridoxal phosphate-dependent decarboxylase family protein n=1 Tax=Hyphomonas sediminis TaxID=2866160 RepID=UPI001C7F99EC|nr:pyridoxal-dependent decarboxylase [Hyphomonas sediminis]MBY9066598.1 cytochrome D ubiquinol oxidase subunit I [Hyphomonas sediminis]